MRNHFDFVSSSRGYLREDETDEKNEIPCSGPEQDTPNRSILGQAFPSRHPDNAPGQDPCLSRKRDVRRIVSPYFRCCPLVSAANSRQCSFKNLDAETSSDTECSVSEMSSHCHPREKGTDHRSRSVPIFRSQRLAISVKRVFDGRSRIGALRDDGRKVCRGRLKIDLKRVHDSS